MLLHILLVILSYSVSLLGILACFLLVAGVRPVVKLSTIHIPQIVEITIAIYKYTVLVALISEAVISLFNVLGYKNISPEVMYFTGIVVLILFQIFKKPEYPIAN